MKQKTKKALSWLLSLALVLGLLPALGTTALALDQAGAKLYVAGVDIETAQTVDANTSGVVGTITSGTATLTRDSESNLVLTLNNFVYSGRGQNLYSGIFAGITFNHENQKLTVNFSGTNSISAIKDDDNGAITSYTGMYGFHAASGSNVIFNGAEGATLTFNTGDGAYGSGISASNFTVTGGTVKGSSESTTNGSMGIYASSISVTGGTLIGAGNSAIQASALPDSGIDIVASESVDGTGKAACTKSDLSGKKYVEITASAPPTPHTHDGITLTAWDSTDSLPAGGNDPSAIYLTQDVTLSSTWVVPNDADYCLCLNGHSITYTGSEDASVISVPADTKLTLYDESGDNGTITRSGNTGTEGYHSIRGGGVEVYGTFVMNGGTITGHYVYEGGGVSLPWTNGEASYFTMNGGVITGNTATGGNGGGVCVGSDYATFTMNGGSITNNKNDYHGGGVYVRGNFTMNGGAITGNEAARDGGGIYVSTSSSVNGGLTLSGNAVISDNKVTGTNVLGGGVYVSQGLFNLSGSPTISGNKKLSGEETETASNLVVSTYYSTVTITGALNNTTPIGMTRIPHAGVFTSGWSTYMDGKTPTDYFTSEDEACTVKEDNGELKMALPEVAYIDHDADGAAETKACDAYTTVASQTYWSDGWYIVQDNQSISSRITASGTVNLILCDGATLTAQKGITVDSGKTLNIYAQSDGENMGVLTATGEDYVPGIGGGGTGDDTSSSGIINIHGGTISATGGKIAAGIGGRQYRANGAITIYGGTVHAIGGQNAAGIGSSSNASAGTVVIYGGTVTATGNNDAMGIGKGLGGSNNGTLTLGTGMYLYGGTSANPENDLSNHRAGAGEYTGTRYQYMTVNSVAPHTHNWSYTANGATITASCGTGCPITTGLTLTISAPTGSLVYDGNPKAATLNDDFNATAFPDTYTITYTKGGAAFTGTPTDAGVYVASVTVGGVTASVEYEITKATPTVTTNPTASEITYGQTLADSTLTGGEASTAGTFAWTDGTTIPTVTNEGYGVTFTPTDTANYNAATTTVALTVNKAEITPTVTLAGWYSGATANEPVLGEGSNPGEGEVTYTYKAKDAEDDTYSADVPTAVGSYTVKATIAETVNYNGGEATADFSISRRPSSGPSTPSTPTTTVTIPVSGDDETVNVTVQVKGDTATVTGADVDKVLEAEDVGTVTIDVSTLKEDVTEVVIPNALLTKINDAVADETNDADGMEIKLPGGTVTFDADALAAITEQADGKDLTLHLDDVKVTELTTAQQDAAKELEVEVVLDAYMTSGGQRISDFQGGSATVKIPYTLKDGQTAQGLVVWYVADDGTKTQVPATYDGKNIVFTVPHFSNYVIAYDAEKAAACPKDDTCPMAAFTDLDPTLWYHDGIHFCLENGMMNGVGNGKFDPYGTTSRAMIVTILYRLEGEPAVTGANPFTDVPDGQWYTNAVLWAAENKIVEGYGNGKFKPNDDITREQLATILYRYAQSKGQGFTGAWMFLLDYPDASEISSWADEAMHWCVMQGIINGKDGELVPGGNASRAESATMIQRFCENVAE